MSTENQYNLLAEENENTGHQSSGQQTGGQQSGGRQFSGRQNRQQNRQQYRQQNQQPIGHHLKSQKNENQEHTQQTEKPHLPIQLNDIDNMYLHTPRNTPIYKSTLMDLSITLRHSLDVLFSQKTTFAVTLQQSPSFVKIDALLTSLAAIFKRYFPYGEQSVGSINALVFKWVFLDQFKINIRFRKSSDYLEDAIVVTLVEAIMYHLRKKVPKLSRDGYQGMKNEYIQDFINDLEEAMYAVSNQYDSEITKVQYQDGVPVVDDNGNTIIAKIPVKKETIVRDLDADYGKASFLGKQEVAERKRLEREQFVEQRSQRQYKKYVPKHGSPKQN